MQVFHGFCDGVQDGAGLSLWEELLLEDSIQQLSSSHQLGDQVHLLSIIIHLQYSTSHWKTCTGTHESVLLCIPLVSTNAYPLEVEELSGC